MKFDDILREVGEFGSYQKWILFFICIPAIHIGALILLNVILFAVPDHRCKIPGLDNDTWNDNSPEHESLVKYYIPLSDTYPYDRCHLYDRTNNSVSNSSQIECHEWVYDMTVFQNTFTMQENLVCDHTIWISHAQTVYYSGILVGSIVFGQLADIIGRKKSFYVCLMLMMASSISLTFAPEFYSFIAIYFILGSVSISTLMGAFVIGVEFVGPSKRLWMVTVIALVSGIGSFYLILMSWLLKDWQKTQLCIGVPAVIYIVYTCIIPESPRWLLSNGQRENAIDVLSKLAKRNGKELTKETLYSLEAEAGHHKGKLWQLFSTKTLGFRTIVIFINWFVVSLAYYGVLLNVGNLGGDFYFNVFLMTIVDYPSKFITLALLNRIGRKKVYVGYMLIGGVMCIGTIYPIVQKYESLHWLLVTLSVLGKMFVSGAFEVLYILSSELYPTVVRNVGMGASSAWARAGSMLSPYIAQLGDLLDNNFAKAIPLTVFGAAAFVGGLLSITLPETVNKKLPDTIEEAHHFDRQPDKEITVSVPRKVRSEYTKIGNDD